MFNARRFFGYTGIIVAAIILIIVAMIVFRLTYALQIFSFTSNANEPTIPRGRILFTSNLKDPKRFDFIAFHNRTEPGSSVWLFRICGMPGDSVEIRNGDLYVNGRAADSVFTLSHSYIVSVKDTSALKIPRDQRPLAISDSTSLVILPDQAIQQSGIQHTRYILPAEVADARIEKIFGQQWNIDFFGPVAVPKDSYFLLGDNRTAAVDSRYIGFINKKDFRGTLIRR